MPLLPECRVPALCSSSDACCKNEYNVSFCKNSYLKRALYLGRKGFCSNVPPHNYSDNKNWYNACYCIIWLSKHIIRDLVFLKTDGTGRAGQPKISGRARPGLEFLGVQPVSPFNSIMQLPWSRRYTATLQQLQLAEKRCSMETALPMKPVKKNNGPNPGLFPLSVMRIHLLQGWIWST